MINPTPKTYYQWLMLLTANGLKCGPLQSFKDARVHHAIKPNTLGNVSFGMWDHQTDTGFIDWDKLTEGTRRATPPPPREVVPAPPIPDGDKEWDL